MKSPYEQARGNLAHSAREFAKAAVAATTETMKSEQSAVRGATAETKSSPIRRLPRVEDLAFVPTVIHQMPNGTRYEVLVVDMNDLWVLDRDMVGGYTAKGQHGVGSCVCPWRRPFVSFPIRCSTLLRLLTIGMT